MQEKSSERSPRVEDSAGSPAVRARVGRNYKSRWTVKAADRVSTFIITVGGIGTIFCVLCVFLVLVAVVLPLFRRAELANVHSATAGFEQNPIVVKMDEYRVLAWALFEDGEIRAFRVDNGETVWSDRILEDGQSITAISLPDQETKAILALSDGNVMFVDFVFQTTFLSVDEIPSELRSMQEGDVAVVGNGVVQVTSQEQFRQQVVHVSKKPSLKFEDEPIVSLHHVVGSNGIVFAAVTEAGKLYRATVRERENFLTGETTMKITKKLLDEDVGDLDGGYVFTLGTGSQVCVLYRRGELLRYDTRNPASYQFAERINVFEGKTDRNVTTAKLSIGNETLNIGDDQGGLVAWFTVRNAAAKTPDGRWMLPIHFLPDHSAEVVALGVSQGSRMLSAAYADGTLKIFHVTTEQELAEVVLADGQSPAHVCMGLKDDGLLVLNAGKIWTIDLYPAYPEASFGSLFGSVWYEGYDRPEHVWQSSSGAVEPEMKLGLRPLMFGTLKGTFYSMLFGAPLALLAAVYTSEILSPRWRSPVKSTIETMASLPSVVLGFLAGLVIAPFVANIVPTVLSSLVIIPAVTIGGGFAWLLLPRQISLKLAPYRLLFVLFALLLGAFIATRVGPLVERALFADDIKLWLDGQKGTSVGAWMFLFVPLSALVVAITTTLSVNPMLVRMAQSQSWSRRVFTVANLLKYVSALIATGLLAYAMSFLMDSLGWDPRGTFVGTYVQRNAMVVGFAMGFAVIPIIYTIAEDALSTVPRHLRSASLGAGATPWQTAVRVVIPTAMSGLFSALMIGLGRAVGETMIVLMAAGNTPIEDWNIFNGFRTLSANIATELPEAAAGSTHYRTLFLAALTLLILTFIVNTMAEFVRLRFRKRAVQL